jgi:peptidoglycan/xylan/chitin deacetylase (PgdA/CDA1 family)
MFSRRSLLKGLGLTGATVGLSGMKVALPLEAQSGAQAPGPRNMWTPDPAAVQLVQDFPAAGVKKIGIPYRGRKGKVKFPNDAKVAVLVFVALDYFIAPPVTRADALFKVDFWQLSETSEYNFSIGGWRALEVLEKNGIKSTVFANGFGVQKYPDIHREFHKRGHEIAAHGWDSNKGMVMYTPQQEAECIHATTDLISNVVGERPQGWLSPQIQCTDKTFKLLADAGYSWNADLRDDDNPYGLKIGDKTMIELPFRTMTTDDIGMWGDSRARIGLDPATATEYFKELLDLYIETGEDDYPLLLVFGLHPYAGCIPDRIRAVDNILRLLKSHPKVWTVQYKTLADYWKKNYV